MAGENIDLSNANSQPAWQDPASAAGPTPDQTQQTVASGNPAPPQAPTQTVTVNGQIPQQPETQNPQVTANVGQQQALQPAPAGSETTLQPKHRFADWIRGAAETLQGGPKYTYSYDQDGNQIKTRVAPSLGHIGAAIALTALQGAVEAAPAKGTNAIGQGAVAGLKSGIEEGQQVTEAEQKQQEQAEQAQKIKQQAVENGFRFKQLSEQVGRQKREDAEALVAADKPLADFFDRPENQSRILMHDGTAADAYKVMAQHPGAQQLHVGTRPRVDANGNPVFINMHGQPVPEGTPGSYQATDFNYRVVDGTPVTGIVDDNGNMTDSYIKEGHELGTINYSGTDGTLPKSYSIPFEQYQDNKLKVQSVNATETQINQAREEQGLDPIDFKGVIKDDKTLLPFLNQFVAHVLNPANPKSVTPYRDALSAIANEGDSGASASGKLSKLLGNPDVLDTQMQRTHTDNQLRANGITDDKDANAALSSDDKQLQIAGKQYFDRKQDLEEAKSRYDANVKLGTEESLAKFKSKLVADNYQPDPDTGQDNPAIVAAWHRISSGKESPQEIMSALGKKGAEFKQAMEVYLDKIGAKDGLEQFDAWDKQAKSAPVLSAVTSGGTLFGFDGKPGTFDRLEDKLTQLGNSKYPWVNSIYNRAKYEAGQKLLAQIKSDYADVPVEASVFVSGLTGRQTDARLEKAGEQLRTADNPQQMLAALHEVRQISRDRYQSFVVPNVYLRKQFEHHNDPTTGIPFSQEGPTGGAEPVNTPTVPGNPYGAKPFSYNYNGTNITFKDQNSLDAWKKAAGIQ